MSSIPRPAPGQNLREYISSLSARGFFAIPSLDPLESSEAYYQRMVDAEARRASLNRAEAPIPRPFPGQTLSDYTTSLVAAGIPVIPVRSDVTPEIYYRRLVSQTPMETSIPQPLPRRTNTSIPR